VSYFEVSNVSSIPKPVVIPSYILVQQGVKSLSVNILGSQLKVEAVKLNGNNENFTTLQGNSSLTLSFPFDSQNQPDGYYQVQIYLSSGLNYQYSLTVVNQYHQYSYQAMLTLLALIALVLATAAIIISLTRRRNTPQQTTT